MNQQNQQLAQAPAPRKDLKAFLEEDTFKFEIRRSMPGGMSVDRFIRIAITATVRNPDLLACTRESFVKCLFDLSQMGLEPDGRRAHLIPFKDNKRNTTVCTMIVDYKGIAELVRRNGDVVSIHCDVVGKNDTFICRYGTEGKLEHIPAIEDRGEIYAVYSFVKLKDGGEEWEVMSAADVEKVRARSRAANSGPWVTDWNEMAKKTVFRRHSKTLPLSPMTRNAVEYGEDEEFDFDKRFANAVPARAPSGGVLDSTGDQNALVDTPEEVKIPREPEKPQPVAAEKPITPPKEKSKPAAAAPPPPTEPVDVNTPEGLAEITKKPARKLDLVSPNEDRKPAKPATKADQLAALLLDAKISWTDWAKWISGLTGIAVPLAPKDLPPHILSDCVLNFADNAKAFEEWLKEVTV